VTVTVYNPAAPEHEIVDWPLVMDAVNVTLFGEVVQAKPDGGEVVTESDTVPVNPWIPVTVIVEVPAALARAVTLAGLAETAKSWIVKDDEAEWVRPLLVPVTVTEYDPAAPEHESDDVALEDVLVRERTEGARLQLRPFEGETVVDRATLPAKPSTPLAIIVVEPATPARVVTVVGVTVRPKSWTVKVTCANAVFAPLLPATVTV
jgi:hypothetical protein